jgi:hypothetical protein
MRNRGPSEKSKGSSTMRQLIEFMIFALWMLMLGSAGFYLGKSSRRQVDPDCPPPPPVQVIEEVEEVDCDVLNASTSQVRSALSSQSGVEKLNRLKRDWKCSKAEFSKSMPKGLGIATKDILSKTKWKSIIAVEPKAFFDKYLVQYPGDTSVEHPVILFSHKPLRGMKDIPEVCKVLDIAVVPNTPGVCIAVTETYHDVASYHMLHAGRQKDGSFSLTANSLDGRSIPDEKAYAGARALLVDYFKYHAPLMENLERMPKPSTKATVGCLVDSLEDMKLFQNSLESAQRAGATMNRFFAVTSMKEVSKGLSGKGIVVIFAPELAQVGADVSTNVRRHFIQSWLAFAAADNKGSVLWQSPGTVWMATPDAVLLSGLFPIETTWAYKGRADRRSAPFYCSFDFFYHSNEDRPIHLFHEILLHTDLVIAWNSLDAVASYRLAENNARCVNCMLP